MTTQIPDGFEPLRFKDPFNEHVGGFFQKGSGPESVYGLALAPQHGNLNGVVHGGVLFAFADAIMGLTLEEAAGRLTATISLNVEFVGNTAPVGWVEGRPELVRLARTVAFLRCELAAGDRTIMTASGVWRVFDEKSDRV